MPPPGRFRQISTRNGKIRRALNAEDGQLSTIVPTEPKFLNLSNLPAGSGCRLAPPDQKVSAMADKTQNTEVPNCTKCSRPTKLLTVLPRFGEQPTYLIFECVGCKSTNWIAQRAR
jgi:hypothetical protein